MTAGGREYEPHNDLLEAPTPEANAEVKTKDSVIVEPSEVNQTVDTDTDDWLSDSDSAGVGSVDRNITYLLHD